MTARALATPRLELRPLTTADGPLIAALLLDPEVRRYLGGPVPAERHAATHARYMQDDAAWCIWPHGSAAPVGLMSLSSHHDGDDIELSFQMLPRVWGQGFGAEAAARLRDHALTDLGHPRLIAETQAANIAARRLLERVGLREDRRVKRFGAEQVIYTT